MRKNRLDEMQEQKLLKIEHNGCWIAFYGLLIAILAQVLLYGRDARAIAGEWIVFMCLSWYIGVSCMRNGIWDRKFSQLPKTNLAFSLAAGIIVGCVFFWINYREYHALGGAAASGIFMFLITVVTCFVSMSFAAHLYRKRKERLENEEEEEGADEYGKE